MAGKATDTNDAAAEQSEDQDGMTEQSEDQAGDETEVEEQADEEESTDEESTEEEAVELLGQEEFDKLQKDPAALRKALNRAATKKFQELASDKKALEPYKGFISALEKDPVKAVTAVARQLGIKIEGNNATTEKTEKVIESLSDRIGEVVKKSLGPDYEDLAGSISTAIHEAMQLAVPELTKGYKEEVDRIVADSALREANSAIEAFEKKFPDWKKYEDKMTALSERMPPGPGMTEGEYLENLYHLVTRDRSTGEGVKKVLSKIKRNAKDGGNGGGGGGNVDDKLVSRSTAKPPSFKEAYEAAKRGERLE